MFATRTPLLFFAAFFPILCTASADRVEIREFTTDGCSRFPDHSLILGSPAKVVRTLTQEDLLRLEGNAASYVARGQLFKAQLKKIG